MFSRSRFIKYQYLLKILAYPAVYFLHLLPVAANSEFNNEQQTQKSYIGKPLSFNFQDIEVRAALQLLADFTDLNLVVNDSVSGSLTLRLNNVPWDQALDIILKTKGLGLYKDNNVLYIAPSEEIFSRKKLALESQQQVEELKPLHSELIKIHYARATNLAALLKNSGNTLLSSRGQISVDERTNTLLIQDTTQKLNEITRLINKLDTPVKQVLIESRIVIANDDFSKSLGAKFGIFNTDRNNNVIVGNLDALEPLAAGDSITSSDLLNVDLPVANETRAGQFSLALAKLPFEYLLNLELSAAQAESRAEVISNPRVITANQNTARIESGTEIPFVSQTSSGATDVEFKQAVLSLEVTPQITPDNRINMHVSVTNDSVGEEFQGIPSIDTNAVTSNVLIENGQTIVLGGIYTENSTKSATRVPFFSDIPFLGRLFKRSNTNQDKQELLIFITPKIISEELKKR